MDQQHHFKEFQNLCISILAESDNCEQSQAEFRAATNYQELVTAWQHFWAGILHEVPSQVLTAFARLYDEYKAELNEAGVFYNENPKDVSFPVTVIVGESGHHEKRRLYIDGRHRVYVLSDYPVDIYGECKVHVTDEHADVTCHDYVSVFSEGGRFRLYNESTFNGRAERVQCYDRSKVFISAGKVEDHGHTQIVAYNDSEVYSNTDKKIELFDKARLLP